MRARLGYGHLRDDAVRKLMLEYHKRMSPSTKEIREGTLLGLHSYDKLFFLRNSRLMEYVPYYFAERELYASSCRINDEAESHEEKLRQIDLVRLATDLAYLDTD